MRRFRSRDDAFGLGEENARCEGFDLRHSLRFDQPVFHQLADDRTRSVVAQTSGVDVRGLEIMPQRVHRQQGRESGHVAEVVLEFAAREFRASFGLHGDHADFLPFGEVLLQEREPDAGEVAAAAEASDHHVGLGIGHLHLLHGLLSDDRLVQHHVVQDAAQAVARILRTAQGHFHGLRNRQSEASRAVRVAFQRCASRIGQRRGRRHALRAPGVHHQTAVGFLVIADLDHEHLQVDAEVFGCEGDRSAPLSGAGLGRQVLDALLVVVVGLRHGGVGLVRTRGRHALVLEIDLRRRSEGLFQPRRAHERRGTPYLVDLLHLFGNVDVAFGGHLLVDQLLGEDR